MKTSRIISIIIIISIIAFLAMYSFGPKQANAPETSEPAVTTTTTPKPVSNDVVATVSTIKENDKSVPAVNVEYPQFPVLPGEFNAAISASVLGHLTDFRETVKENDEARNATANHEAAIPLSAYSFTASWQPAQVNNNYVSLVVRYDAYAGGANGDQELETFNYDVFAKKMISLGDLFPKSKDYLKQISVLVRKDLNASLDKASEGNAPVDMIAAGTEAVAENFSRFTFTDAAVTFYFPKYAVAPGSFGEQRVVITRTAIK